MDSHGGSDSCQNGRHRLFMHGLFGLRPILRKNSVERGSVYDRRAAHNPGAPGVHLLCRETETCATRRTLRRHEPTNDCSVLSRRAFRTRKGPPIFETISVLVAPAPGIAFPIQNMSWPGRSPSTPRILSREHQGVFWRRALWECTR